MFVSYHFINPKRKFTLTVGEGKELKKKLLVVLFGILAVGLLCGFALSARAAVVDNTDDTIDSGTVVTVVPGTEYSDNCVWGNVFDGTKGWSIDTWVLTWSGGGFEIRCHDMAWYGDFYSVWIVDTSTGTTVCKLLTTPEVETDYHHSCTDNPLHTGTGSTYSDRTYGWWLPAGTYEFKVRDELFHVLWAEGIAPTTPQPWSPAGVYIGFYSAPHIIPDVPWGTVMSAVAMMVGLMAYVGTKHTHILRRP